jgi:hypothetical protein
MMSKKAQQGVKFTPVCSELPTTPHKKLSLKQRNTNCDHVTCSKLVTP